MLRIRWFYGITVLLAATGCGKKDDAGGGQNPSGEPKAAPRKSSLGVWNSYSPPSRSFRASFPFHKPVPHPFTGFDPHIHAPFLAGNHYRADRAVQDGERFYLSHFFEITEIKYAANVAAAEREKGLDELVDKMAELGKFKWPDPKLITWSGKPAKEYVVTQTIELPSGNKQARTTFRVIATDKFAFIGSVRDMGEATPEDEKRFFDSFELLPEVGSKK
jgi:hypothetical protein